MPDELGPCWLDGRLVDPVAAGLPLRDSAAAHGRGCYTTARIRRGGARFAREHALRLARDARRLAIGKIDPQQVVRALESTGRACFGKDQEGVVRVQASRDGAGRVHLCAIPRPTGPEPVTWRACVAPFPHEGPMPWSGAKVTNHLLFALAGDAARRAGADEALLLDRDGYLVEGSRSNLIVVFDDGVPRTPDLIRGGVAGVGLHVLRTRTADIAVRHVSGSRLASVRELIAVNAVRGPRPIVALSGRTIGDGRPGPVATRLAALFERG